MKTLRLQDEFLIQGKREYLFVCVCYIPAEYTGAQVKNRSKYDILKRFISQHENEKIMVVGDMNGFIGLLEEGDNANEKLLRVKVRRRDELRNFE